MPRKAEACPSGHAYSPENKIPRKGGSHYCRACSRVKSLAYKRAHPTETRERLRAYRREHPAKAHAHMRSRICRGYGLTVEQYDALLSKQDHRCAICRIEKCGTGRAFAIDHDHRTGKVRGLLCASCNNGIGRFRHDQVRLAAAITYLQTVDEV